MPTWTDAKGALVFRLKRAGSLCRVTQFVLGIRAGDAWGNACSIPVPSDLFKVEGYSVGDLTRIQQVITPQYSMIFYQRATTFSRRELIFLCYLALRSEEGTHTRVMLLHLLKAHLFDAPPGADKARATPERFFCWEIGSGLVRGQGGGNGLEPAMDVAKIASIWFTAKWGETTLPD